MFGYDDVTGTLVPPGMETVAGGASTKVFLQNPTTGLFRRVPLDYLARQAREREEAERLERERGAGQQGPGPYQRLWDVRVVREGHRATMAGKQGPCCCQCPFDGPLTRPILSRVTAAFRSGGLVLPRHARRLCIHHAAAALPVSPERLGVHR